jgi:hypothetical protein
MAVDPVSLAVTATLTAANMAMTAMQTIEGPRVRDTAATLADYGTPMNYFVGQRIISCPAIFTKPIEEVKKKRKGKGGKRVNYTGFGTWACHIADHEIARVLKIWFDNYLVYDATGGTEEIYPLGADYELDTAVRIYLGTETQMPDPDMQAFVEARDGAGTCPAYRGEAYAYFDRVPLEMLGNRFPDVKMLVQKSLPTNDFLGLSWQIQCSSYYNPTDCNCTSGTSDGVIMPGDPGVTTDYSFRIRGVIELNPYSDGTPLSPSYVKQTAIGVELTGLGAANHYKLRVSDPPADYYLNNGPHGETNGEVVDYILTIPITGGATISLLADTKDSRERGNADLVVAPDDDPARPITVMQPYDGQFLQMDIVGTDLGTLGDLLTQLALAGGASADEISFGAATQQIPGLNWTQATGRQICEAVVDLFDTDLRPHDFLLEALPRGTASQGVLDAGEMVRDDPLFRPSLPSPSELPQKVALSFADTEADQNPNVASPPGPDPAAAGSSREMSIDMGTLALDPTTAQQLATRSLRRQRVGAMTADFGLTRRRLGIEPGDVWTPDFDGHQVPMRATKVVLGADGRISGTWARDLSEIATLPDAPGAVAAGYVPPAITAPSDTIGHVMDMALVSDAHEQSAPFAYLVAGPEEPGPWAGADFVVSDTGELDSYTDEWSGVVDSDGSIIGTVAETLPDTLPWVPDLGSTITVTLNYGELTSATLEELLLDGTLNLAAVQSGDGWELVQFMNAELVGPLEYELSGFLRGVRGTEWAMAGHADGDVFILLETLVRKTLGAAEIGDTDYYIVSATGATPDQDTAEPLLFAGAAHKPYSPVHGTQEASGADLVFDAVRRTRIGGATLNGQDVPLGQASESWALDILDGPDVVRTITSTSLPITYAEADQITDFGSAQASVAARLYQVDPTLNLRGYPLAFAA